MFYLCVVLQTSSLQIRWQITNFAMYLLIAMLFSFAIWSYLGRLCCCITDVAVIRVVAPTSSELSWKKYSDLGRTVSVSTKCTSSIKVRLHILAEMWTPGDWLDDLRIYLTGWITWDLNFESNSLSVFILCLIFLIEKMSRNRYAFVFFLKDWILQVSLQHLGGN